MGVRSLGNALASFGYKFGTTGLEAVSPAPPPAGLTASGGTTTEPGNGYKYHFFTSPGTFQITDLGNIDGQYDYVLIAGGGGGGFDDGGGGGAGGYIENTNVTATIASFPISIGNGGAGETNNSPSQGADGSPSTGFSQTANGGGGGGGNNSPNGRPGGSGGGERSSGTAGSASPSPNVQGFPGGNNPSPLSPSPGGGGGAGGAAYHNGETGDVPGGSGGPGKAAFSGDTGIPPSYGTPGPSAGRWFAGGGAGGGRTPAASQPGVGGGGALASNGTANTGGGGGGMSDNTAPVGSGGSGICIVRYRITPE